MAELPEHLLIRSAEARAKALGLPVEQVLAEMRGEAPPPAPPEAAAPENPPEEAAPESPSPETEEAPQAEAAPSPPEETPAETPQAEAPEAEEAVAAADPTAEPPPAPSPEAAAQAEQEEPAAAVITADTPGPPTAEGNGAAASSVSPRPVIPPTGIPEGVRPQRLLTVVKARAIQQVKATPTDKVNTWPHLMIAEFSALMVITAALIVLSVILQAPLLELANFNATPNPSKAPWYFLGLQELLSYYDPQIAGVIIPTITGLVGFMAIPYVDRNPSTNPADRKFAIMLFTLFLAGSATLTIIGVLFRGPGFNFTYPWADGIWFDDLKDWVHFE